MQKKCRSCKVEKDVINFGKDASEKDGFRSECKDCRNPRNNEHKRERRKNNALAREIEKNTKLKKYGISLDDYKKMLVSQGNLCAICGENTDKKSLHVDHCHKTGKVRELLCSRCNTVLGRLDDDVSLLKKMSLYLQRHLTPLAPDLLESGQN